MLLFYKSGLLLFWKIPETDVKKFCGCYKSYLVFCVPWLCAYTTDGLNWRLETAEKRIGKLEKRAKEIIHDTEQRHGEMKTSTHQLNNTEDK